MRNIVIIRHPRERKSKCTLEPLREREAITFYNAASSFQYDASGHILLSVKAPVLTLQDAIYEHPLIILDSTWRLLPQLENCLTGTPLRRSLPSNLKTAYPRVSKISEDPATGLASIEALHAALDILGERDDSLLDAYHWKSQFLQQFRH